MVKPSHPSHSREPTSENSRLGSREVGISVLICTRNRSEMLADCLKSVLAGDRAPVEILVVDQSQNDETERELAQFQEGPVPVRYVRDPGCGVSRAKNLGIGECRGALIAFTDDDCKVEPAWLTLLTEPFLNLNTDAVVGKTLAEPTQDATPETFSYYAPAKPPAFNRRTHPWRVGGGGNFAARRETLLSVGPFDEQFGPGAPFRSAEDMDLVHRLLRSGKRIEYAPRAVVRHRSWRSAHGNRHQSRGYGVGSGAYFAKYVLKGDWLSGWRFLARFSIRFLQMVGALLQGRGSRFREQAHYLVGLLEGAAGYLRTGKSAPSPFGLWKKKQA